MTVTYSNGPDHPLFWISDLDFADPCIEEKLSSSNGEMCGGHDRMKECIRNTPSITDGFNCSCIDGYTDKHCDVIDYCGHAWGTVSIIFKSQNIRDLI